MSQEIPRWLKESLQGLTFWVGHRRSIYQHYELLEAALIAELANLIHANLKDGRILECEVGYSGLDKNVDNKTRADLVIYKTIRRGVNKKKKSVLEHVIEIKRYANKQNIPEDLKRLSQLKKKKKNVRIYMVIVSEKGRPKEYVSENGIAIKQNCLDKKGIKHSIRVLKATSSFEKKENAHYAVILELK